MSSKSIHRGRAPRKHALALAVAGLFGGSVALAQGENIEEIEVTGIRAQMMNAQDIKFNADTVIESITAEDLGSFPDKSIAEALQRVSGITVNRFAASDDTAHFSAEPSGVIVRGLNQVRTEFNGRDSFSANSSRGLSWTDVSPELMARVDTYKNQMAELIEGGIAGTVDMRTRVPFDQSGRMIAATVNANYGSLSEEWTPEVSGLWSDRWDVGGGEIGFLANLAWSKVKTNSEGIQLYRMNRFRDVYPTEPMNIEGDLVYIPAQTNFRDTLYDRERTGVSLAFQWRDSADRFLLTTQFNRSQYENAWEEYVVGISPADLSYEQSLFYEITGQDPDNPNQDTTIPVPAPGTAPFTFDGRGLFQSGVMTTGVGWRGPNDPADPAYGGYGVIADGTPMVNPCYGWAGCSPNVRGIDAYTVTRANQNENMTQDFGVNLKWRISDRVKSNFDLHFVDSEVDNYDIEVGFWTYATVLQDLSGEHPRVVFQEDNPNINFSPGGYENPNNYYLRHIMDHLEDSEGQQVAVRADFEFELDSGWARSIKTGVRLAERDQTVRWSDYNWESVANNWANNQADQRYYFNLDRHEPANGLGPQPNFTGYPQGYYETLPFENQSYGGQMNLNRFVFADMDFISDRERMAASLGAPALGFENGVGWEPLCSGLGDRANEIEGTCFTPAEVVDLVENTQAAYLQCS
ncbi:MAG: hypothetical protein KatS3mg121_0896 [Gammaproteobacteria bacterium]|nr:MAG: hypothetical protein KatS3mg121_0896 [Gammaproteobacteria bacterium]